MESKTPAVYRLGKIKSKYLILDVIFSAFYQKKGFSYLFQGSRSLRYLLIKNYEVGR
jgi:hypothetical protein